MVKIRDEHFIHSDAEVDIESWLKKVQENSQFTDVEPLRRACKISYQANKEAIEQGNLWGGDIDSFQMGLEMVEILVGLNLDLDSLVAATVYRAVREERVSIEQIEKKFGKSVAKLVMGVSKMAAIGEFLNLKQRRALGQKKIQLENVRKMLVAMVDDVRVALIKLAERTSAIRAVKNASSERQLRVAREIMDIYAPLAHRLGIGHIKWELEDLSFRYLQPEAYKKIAGLLVEKRLEREKYIADVLSQLSDSLQGHHIQAELSGRVKHIYSIWRKMQRKNIDFNQVYDIRAVRILVPDTSACYAALGITHSIWQHIPNEFDDYIANPKENGYRSLHTAVIGPKGRVLEVQIRSQEMHDEAELGVCAHWRYKESPHAKVERSYEDKISWLRQVLEWNEEIDEKQIEDLAEQFNSHSSQEYIYLFTPDGHVLEMVAGSTPVDFAYHIHTEVGHRCRGAKVNGHIVPLNYVLSTGQQVEILTGKDVMPRRDWLNVNSGYIHSSRARAKVQHWFKLQARDKNIVDGKALLGAEFKRLSVQDVDLDQLAEKLNIKTGEDVLASIGAGDLRVSQVISTLGEFVATEEDRENASQQRAIISKASNEKSPNVTIHGLDGLMTHIAKCCKPVPGELIAGYITLGRGITVHSRNCSHLSELSKDRRDRLVEVSWGDGKEKTYPVDVHISSFDRRGLLNDITEILAKCDVNVTAMTTLSDRKNSTADMKVTLEVTGVSELSRVLTKINQLPNIIEVERVSS